MRELLLCPQERASKIEAYLRTADNIFVPPLSTHLDLSAYAEKISRYGHVLWAVQNRQNVGMCAFYANCLPEAYLTSLSTLAPFQRTGIGTELLQYLKAWCRDRQFLKIKLEVYQANIGAQRLYQHAGFEVIEIRGEKWLMQCNLV